VNRSHEAIGTDVLFPSVDKTSVNEKWRVILKRTFGDSKTSFCKAKSSFGMSDEKPEVLLEMPKVSVGIMYVRAPEPLT
jgi:hypothetical protein